MQRVRVARYRGRNLIWKPYSPSAPSTEVSNETSEESNETLEESNHKSEEFRFSSLGIEEFLRWNRRVPPLEPKSSSLGTKKFQEENFFWNSYVIRKQDDTSVTHFASSTAIRVALGRDALAVCPYTGNTHRAMPPS